MKKPNPIVLFVVDGLRSDGMVQAKTKHLDHLISEGAHTLSARTIVPSITLPCLASLIYSIEPSAHQITTNSWRPLSYPGLHEIIFQAGMKSAVFINWEQLRDLHQPGSVEALFCHKDDDTPGIESDWKLAELARSYLSEHHVDFAFIYFNQTDAAGHRDGWMSPPYLNTITNVDHCIGTILKVLPKETLVMVTTDHGGKGYNHGADTPEETTIPFIIKGPDIPKGYQIQRLVRIIDIAPTIISSLGIELPIEWAGKAITFTSTKPNRAN